MRFARTAAAFALLGSAGFLAACSDGGGATAQTTAAATTSLPPPTTQVTTTTTTAPATTTTGVIPPRTATNGVVSKLQVEKDVLELARKLSPDATVFCPNDLKAVEGTVEKCVVNAPGYLPATGTVTVTQVVNAQVVYDIEIKDN